MLNKRILSILILSLLLLPAGVSANNLNIANGVLTSQDGNTNTIKTQFDISWDNSWRDIVNNDAVWVFIKFSDNSGKTWKHGTLKTSGTNPSGFSFGLGTPVDLIVPSDKRGVFIQRADNGRGTTNTTRIQLVWDYGADGLSDNQANSLDTRIKIYGIEMVYIPGSSFLAGDQDATAHASFKGGWLQDLPIAINSEDAVVFNNAEYGPYYYRSAGQEGESTNGANFVVPSTYPKGYAAIYMMKYELSQGAWIDFFNTLSDEQKTNRDITGSTGKNSDGVVFRNAVSWIAGEATLANGRENDRACNYLSWSDFAAYADWAALRPMSELEFEKAGRGPNQPVKGEYAWGNTVITPADTISGTEDGTETVATSNANACYNAANFGGGDGGRGPLRCGIFANSATDRVEAGASYYGIMELSGNVWERCVTIGNNQGLSFIGSNGDGALTTAGNATNTDWPGIDASPVKGVTGATGSGIRGGSWYETDATRLTVANRSFAATTDNNRDARYGGRFVRTAP